MSGVRAIRCLPEYAHQGNAEINSKAMLEQVRRCTWRASFSRVGGLNQSNLEIQFKTVIKQVWIYAIRGHNRTNLEAGSSVFADGLEEHDCANL
jgi:hypothetical protein